MTRTFIATNLLLAFSATVFAQDAVINSYFKNVERTSISLKGKQNIKASHYRLVEVDINQLYALLENAPHRDGLKSGMAVQIALPLPDGSTHLYRVLENSTLSPELGVKYPEIKTYDAYGLDNPSEFVKLDITPHGFHAMILTPGKSPIFIDPFKKGNTQYYIVYNKTDLLNARAIKCGVESHNHIAKETLPFKHFVDYNPCELKTYRLAMAATAQYTLFHGGTVMGALAAEATTMSRVNGIYETDMAITMQIISRNNEIIYTNPLTQPYTSGVPALLIDQNQVNVDAVIGSADYDIGHVVDAAGSGLAQVASVCTTEVKAMGVTGTNSPIGDPFDVDFVAHEMGHQFGARHTQNNACNRNDPTAVEPGSGSTIMGYAGICAPNVQANSDSYFHGISLQQMGDFVSSPSHTCPIKTPIASAPMITSTNGFHVVPANTPFALTALALPSESNILSYTWEQMNNEITIQPPMSTATEGPNFRSLPPSVSSTRFFPNLTSLANNGPFIWEVLPSVSRDMQFRVSVRNNTFGGSCNAFTDVTLTTEQGAGPFVVTSPNSPGIIWQGSTLKSINWAVANTDIPPVNSKLVNVLLSIDGGLSYPFSLFQGIPNNGATQLCVPNINTNTARLMVQAANGTFFNISNYNFSITALPPKPLQLTQAERNPMETTEAFIYFGDCIPASNDVYTVNGLPGATIQLDTKNNRFKISNIRMPKRVIVSISTRTDANVMTTSNTITIPSIL